MSFRFRTLLTLSVTHGYYGGACGDLGFVLPADTVKLLNGGRLVVRPRDGVLHVLFEEAANGGPLVSAAGQRLRIGLKQLNPQFANITAGVTNSPRVMLYLNDDTPSQLRWTQVWLVGPKFTHTLTDATRPVQVTLHGFDPGLSRDAVEIEDDQPSVPFDLTGEAPVYFLVDDFYPSENTTQESGYYLDPELQQEGVVAIVELRLDAAFYSAPPVFTVAYEPRQETLKYYLVAENHTPAEAGLLSVVDAGFTEDNRPEIVFTRVPSGDFSADDLPAGLLGGSSAQVVLFQSQALVPRQHKARRKLQLVRTSTGDVLIEHLPQPGANRPHADLIIHVSKP
jgi:hypothetical protein